MEIHVHRKLPSSEIYACSKNEARACFQGIDELGVHFGEFTHFEFDRAVKQPPKLKGVVVASALVSREGEVSIQLYPLKKADFIDHEHLEFVEKELTEMKDWALEEQARPELEVHSQRQLLIVLMVEGFRHHSVEFS